MELGTSLGLTVLPPRSGNIDLLRLESDWHSALDLRVQSGEMSDITRRTYKTGLSKFLDWCADKVEIGADTIRVWIASLREAGLKPATINTWLAGVRSFFSWAFGQSLIPYNPAAGISSARRTTSRKHKREPLTDGEVRRVLALPDDTEIGLRDRAILYLMAYTAARTIEVHRADLSNLKTRSGRLVLEVQGKGREESDEVIVIAHPDAEAAMHDWLAERGNESGALFISLSRRSRGDRLSLASIREIVKGYFAKAGVHGKLKTTHSLRHSAISSAVRHHAPIEKAKAMARHASINTTLIYVHERDRIENPAEDFIRYDGDGQ